MISVSTVWNPGNGGFPSKKEQKVVIEGEGEVVLCNDIPILAVYHIHVQKGYNAPNKNIL